MKTHFSLPLFAAVLMAFPALPAAHAAKAASRSKQTMEAATRLQVFLDRADFAPGKIDGHYGEFTLKALALYRQSQGAQASTPSPPSKKTKDRAPDVSDLNLASVDPVFISYT